MVFSEYLCVAYVRLIFDFETLPNELAFDHAQVLADYRKYRETGQVASLCDKPARELEA